MMYNLYYRGAELTVHQSAEVAGTTDIRVWQVLHASSSLKPKTGDRCTINKFHVRGADYMHTAINTSESLNKLGVLHFPSAETIHSLRSNTCTVADPIDDYVRKNRMAKIAIEIDEVGTCTEPTCTLIADNMSRELANAIAIVLVATIYEHPIYQGPMSRTKAPLFEIRAENIDFNIAARLQHAICSILFQAPRTQAYTVPVTPLVAAKRAEAETRAQERLQMRIAKEQMAAEFQKTRALAVMQRAKARCEMLAASHTEKADELAATMKMLSSTVEKLARAQEESHTASTNYSRPINPSGGNITFPREDLVGCTTIPSFLTKKPVEQPTFAQRIFGSLLPEPKAPTQEVQVVPAMEQDSGDESGSNDDESPFIDPVTGEEWMKSF
jgi:hypothetical protein